MSEGNNVPKPPIANRSWLHSEPARLTLRALQTPRNLDSARRNLESQYSSDSEPEPLPENVVSEHDFPFTSFDASLIAHNATDHNHENQNETRRTRPYISRTPSRVSLRREFSLTSYESDTFDPEEIYQLQGNNMPAPHTPLEQAGANVHPTAVDNEIARLRQTIGRMGQQIDEGLHTSSAAARQEPNDNNQILDVLNLIRADIHALSTRVTRIENAETHSLK